MQNLREEPELELIHTCVYANSITDKSLMYAIQFKKIHT